MTRIRKLRLILGDQLNHQHSWFREKPASDILYVLMETRSETDYARHHIQKIVGFFLAMRAFADHLRAEGFQVKYLLLDDPANRQQIAANLKALIEEYGVETWEYQLPDEHRLDVILADLAKSLPIPVTVADTEHFLSPRDGVDKCFAGKKTYLLETFYRKIRRQYGILMEPDGETPLTGRWNFDAENRHKMPAEQPIPPPWQAKRDVTDLVGMLNHAGVVTIGKIDTAHYSWPVTRAEALDLLQHFLRFRLRYFGRYQDALTSRQFLLFHSMLSFVMNVKLLHPLEVVQAVIHYWEPRQGDIELATVEGFIRQIIGWREYMRGVYWAKMPAYRDLNYFGHTAPLPGWYWTGETKMACLSHAIGQSLEYAYAHHIQRLMVTGNFALLLGVHPDEVDAWYLGIYMDALEWVEITNTRGMSQFADGGIVGTKPYVSSANYIHKMSDYCQGCAYDSKKRTGEGACPFNSLYWDFYDRHTDKLARNPRIGMMYRTWDKMSSADKEAILRQAAYYKQAVEQL